MTRDLPADGNFAAPNRSFAGSVRSISALVILGRFSGSGVITMTGFGVSVGVVTTGVGAWAGAGVCEGAVVAAGFSVCSGCAFSVFSVWAGGDAVATGAGCFCSGCFVSSVLAAAGFSGCGAGAVTTGVGVGSGAFAAAGFSGAGSSFGFVTTGVSDMAGASVLAGGAAVAGLSICDDVAAGTGVAGELGACASDRARTRTPPEAASTTAKTSAIRMFMVSSSSGFLRACQVNCGTRLTRRCDVPPSQCKSH